MNKEALFSDETEWFCFPSEPKRDDIVTITFQTAANDVNAVYFIAGKRRSAMKKDHTNEVFDYYKIDITMSDKPLLYYFEIHGKEDHCFYNKKGVTEDLQDRFCFGLIPGFSTPDWAKGAVMYQIFTDRFCNGDTSNDVIPGEYCYVGDLVDYSQEWTSYPKSLDVSTFYGGDLQGVWDKLDYLEKLGIEALYFNPLFVSPSNHKYDCQDYDYIDPHFTLIKEDGGEVLLEGEKDNRRATKYIARVANITNLEASNDFFAKFCEEVHKRDMKIIIDGVFNHCGSFNKWMDREQIYEDRPGFKPGAYIDEDSPYHTFFQFYNEHEWPYNSYYDGWWGYDTLPKLNYEKSSKLEKYILNIAQKWVSAPYCVDGWRLDVAADLGHSLDYNHAFWKKFRDTVKKANPKAMIYAEHYGESRDWLSGNEWDTVMNYDAFMEPVTWFLTGMEKHGDEYKSELYGNGQSFVDSMIYHMSSFHMPSLMTAMNQLSNHDHSRFLTRTNHLTGRVEQLGPEAAETGVDKGVLREAVVILMTWVGAPTLYYGDEVGQCGFTDPDNRRTYPWGKEDFELLEFHRDMILIHKRNQALRIGSIKILMADYHLLCYGRFTPQQQIIVAVNNANVERTIQIPVWQVNVPYECEMERLMMTTQKGYNVGVQKYEVHDGILEIHMPPISSMVFRYETSEEEKEYPLKIDAYKNGGNQMWFTDQKLISQYGCGLIGLSDLCLVISHSPMVLTKEKYMEFVITIQSKYARVRNLLGLNGISMAAGFNRYCRDNHMEYRGRWGVRHKDLRSRISKMLHERVPVILSIGPPFDFNHSSNGVMLFEKKASGYTPFSYCKNHYVTVTGEEVDEKGRDLLEIHSWGKCYYIDYEEYKKYAGKNLLRRITSNILYVQMR